MSVLPEQNFQESLLNQLAMGRPLEYKSWSKEKLKLACEAVWQGKSMWRAEIEYGVPKSTIHDHVSGRALCGANRYLSDKEEVDLVNFLLKCCRIGFARSRKQIISLVQSYL